MFFLIGLFFIISFSSNLSISSKDMLTGSEDKSSIISFLIFLSLSFNSPRSLFFFSTFFFFKAHKRYQNHYEEEKEKKQWYGCEQYNNFPEDEKQRLSIGKITLNCIKRLILKISVSTHEEKS